MEKVKQLIPRIAILLAGVFVGVVIQQSCSHQMAVGSDFNNDEFIEKLSNYE